MKYLHTLVRIAPAAAVIAALSLHGCAPPPPSGLTASDESAIRAAEEAFETASNNEDWDALAAQYAEDALLAPPNQPATSGRDNIREVFATTTPPGATVDLEIAEVTGVGDLAYVYGSYTLTVPMGEESITDVGKYIEIRRRQADGSWPITVDMWNSNMPPPGMPPMEEDM